MNRHAIPEGFEPVRLAASKHEQPMPLFRPDREPGAFPVDALGDTLGAAATGVIDIVQCPDGIAAQAILAATALAVQSHVDVVIPATDHASPTSLFIVSVAATGERKSAADKEAMKPIGDWEKERYDIWKAEKEQYKRDQLAYDIAKKQAEKAKDFEAARAALDALPAAPIPPLTPILTTSEPTLEGLLKLLQAGYPGVGIFADEGGSFFGGHGMSSENRLRTITGLSDLWGGRPINRVRSGDGASIIFGKRCSLHVMVQPGIAQAFLSDEQLRDQGFLSRLLVSAPRSTVGTRFQRQPLPGSRLALARYNSRISEILYRGAPLREGTRNELEPRRLEFSREAARQWLDYADQIELCSAIGGRLHPVVGLANKLPEHAARIAAVLECAENIAAAAISSDTLARAIVLANYYAEEALRLFGAGVLSPEIAKAEKVRLWLLNHWREPYIDLRHIQQYGPNAVREKKEIEQSIVILEEHGWLSPVSGGAVVRGERAAKAWTVANPEASDDR